MADELAGFEACEPPWDDGADPRWVTWNGQDLTMQPREVQDLFYRVWGTEKAMQRWRWEYECQHPAPSYNRSAVGCVHGAR